ncbi:MAG: hypothetical protein ABSF32_09290 [Ignavibacteria bacterium]|jgi:hypothetical protein
MKRRTQVSIIIILFAFLTSVSYSQVYSQKDIISQYDPFSITINDLVLNTNDDEFADHSFVIIITILAGNEKIDKFLYRDDLAVNSVKNYDDVFWSINFSVRRNNTILVPAIVNLPNSPVSITIKAEGYSNLNEGDQVLMNQLSTGFCYTSSTMFNLMDLTYKYLANSQDVNRPNYSGLFTTAEVLVQNISKRPDIFYLGNPAEMNLIAPQDPKKVIGTNILVQGKRPLENKVSLKAPDQWNMTFTKIPDVRIVQTQPYYNKIRGVFNDLTALQIIPENKREGNLAKADFIIKDDLVMGRNADVYMNDQVVKQFDNLLYLLKAGVRVKSDTASTTSDFMNSDERGALSYFEDNLRDNDFNLDNQYLYDDYINSSVNRGLLQTEIDLIKRYYEIR